MPRKFDPTKYTKEKPYRFKGGKPHSVRYSIFATCWQCRWTAGGRDTLVTKAEADRIEREAREHHLTSRVTYRHHGASRYECWSLNPSAHPVSIARTRHFVIGTGM